MKRLAWTPAKVGCYWHADSFSISTVREMQGWLEIGSGYALSRDRRRIGVYATLDEAKHAAEYA
jgi:hypothetical protein